jgi:hypothetical protein
MLAVGFGAGYEAIKRIFAPEIVEVNYLTFIAAILSGTICLLLSIYQQYVATRSEQQALIAQAVDSRNHAIVAFGVITGLVATLLHFPLLDTLVGLAVAFLILKSGIELAIETVRSLRGEEVDYSQYELDFVEKYRRFQEQKLDEWLLYLIVEEGPLYQSDLTARCQQYLNIRDVPILHELGWDQSYGLESKVGSALDRLHMRGLITMGEVLQATKLGTSELDELSS